ncbi:hypothetical protein M378DRAFT_162172 [Amanita muscaria Koide BX008]|uniref:Uncharacterized protein n=1 Tax=Amanita muscaria (strain Koide BX008) TaxID=946122 RepID=A0A0C2X8Z3_AMAMK|nr:hypothetical protein M378DRAFT_162172 [Amanita muscaria Koide BX008]
MRRAWVEKAHGMYEFKLDGEANAEKMKDEYKAKSRRRTMKMACTITKNPIKAK